MEASPDELMKSAIDEEKKLDNPLSLLKTDATKYLAFVTDYAEWSHFNQLYERNLAVAQKTLGSTALSRSEEDTLYRQNN